MSHWNPEHIGVTTSATSIYQRSNFDMKMMQEMNPVYQKCGPPKPHQYEAFHISPPNETGTHQGYKYRTEFDKNMMMDHDAIYRKSNMVRELYQPRHSHIYDDPYNKFSYNVLQPDMI